MTWRPAWLTIDTRRSWLSFALSIPVTVVAILLLTDPDSVGDVDEFVGLMASWTSFTLLHTLTTLWAFIGLDHDALVAAHERNRRDKPSGWRRWVGWLYRADGEAPAWSAQLSMVALLMVGALAVRADLRESAVLVPLAAALVVSSWINMLVVFTAQYARLDVTSEDGLEFPGDTEPSFGDYWYVASNIQTTFGTTDVAVTSPVIRRVVATHGLLAFVFNTVIIAMAVGVAMNAT